MAGHKKISEHDFIQHFTRLGADRQGLALVEKPDGGCVFLEGDDCAVQAVKPQQCRDFPNLWSFPGFEKVCHAVPRELDATEYKRRLAAATGRNLV